MKLQQVNSLKLNAKKINSVLIKGNSNVKKLKANEKSLLLRIDDQKKKKIEEKKVESKSKFKLPGQGVLGKVIKPVMSIFDKLLNFFGNILLGILITELPKAIAAAQKFFDDNPWIIPTFKNIFKFLGNTLMGMIDLANTIKPSVISAFEASRDAFIGALDLFGFETNALLSEEKSAEKSVDEAIAATQTEDDESPAEQVQPTEDAQPTREVQPTGEGPTSVPSNPDIPSPPITPVNSAPEIPSQEPREAPREVQAPSVTPDASNPPSKSSPVPSAKVKPVQTPQYKSGGLTKSPTNRRGRKIKPRRRPRMVKETGAERSAREALISYSDFHNNIKSTKKLEDEKEDSNESFKKFLELYTSVNSTVGVGTQGGPGGGSPNGRTNGPAGPAGPPGPGSSLVSVDASGEPGYDFTPPGGMNHALFDGVVQKDPVGTNHQISGNSGYGNFMIIKHEDPNRPGNYFDALYAHFPNQNFKKPGEKVKKGEVLGRMGTLNDPFDQRGSITGTHMSVDFFSVGGPYSKYNGYSGWRNLHQHIDPMALPSHSSSGLTPVQQKHFKNNKGGSITGLTKNRTGLNQSMNSTRSEVVYIIQPIVKRGRSAVVVKHIDRPIPVPVSNSRNISKPSLA